MFLDKLYLEITRNCTLNCEHCLKGDKEHKNMSFDTLHNIFKDVEGVNTLLLTGGEPLLNIGLINELINIINSKNININTIGIVTNGTVFSNKHLDVLKRLKSSCDNFKFFLSSDLFHRLEWDRLAIRDKVNNNYQIYNDNIGIEKFLENDRFKNVILCNKGRARTITNQRINELNKMFYITLKINEMEDNNNLYYEDNNIFGKVCIDVNGNIVDYSISYLEEDLCSNGEYNVNNHSFNSIIYKYIDSKNINKQKIKRYY